MANTRYGLKEVANVILFDVATNKPVLFFDTLKVSTIENESESAEARGGQGNGRLMTWDFGRTATLTLQDALLSDVSLSLLAGTTVKTDNIEAVGREVISAKKEASGDAVSVSLAQTPKEGSVTVYKVEKGLMTDEVVGITVEDKKVTIANASGDKIADGASVMVFYTYTAPTGATMVTFNGANFPATYRVVGDTVVRGQDGVDRKMQFIVPKAKLQSTFNLTMDAENVSTFDFTLDVLVDAETNKLYDIIRL
ncbi:virion structural protein [Bacillus phage vB_BanS_Nate]|uniref:Tail tube protein n=1 Tax=Bacillus phage vB_BanS_Nate TaxID=2894788 RepID=A0AAE8YUK5_9CAUD|nr:virion structural protein [Bacillus phage vB_BanS_Nate]UGO51073.1 tail tube protein [Bacillus phage vB_BanS_Nate]